MSLSIELTNFQKRCHHYHTCFVLAKMGLQNFADQFEPRIIKNSNQNLFLGSGPPEEGGAVSQISLKEAVTSSRPDSVFSDTLAKSLLVTIYTEWDEIYRQGIGNEVGVEAKKVMSDLMGDLRLVRNWIIHNKSVICKNYTKIKILPWHFVEGHKLKVSNKMFSEMITCINTMTVKIAEQ